MARKRDAFTADMNRAAAMALDCSEDYAFRRLEAARVQNLGVARTDNDQGVIIARNHQATALAALGEKADQMIADGYDINVVRATLNAAPAIAAHNANEIRIVARRILAPATDTAKVIRMRGSASMYNISRDARVDDKGVKIESIYGPARR